MNGMGIDAMLVHRLQKDATTEREIGEIWGASDGSEEGVEKTLWVPGMVVIEATQVKTRDREGMDKWGVEARICISVAVLVFLDIG